MNKEKKIIIDNLTKKQKAKQQEFIDINWIKPENAIDEEDIDFVDGEKEF